MHDLATFKLAIHAETDSFLWKILSGKKCSIYQRQPKREIDAVDQQKVKLFTEISLTTRKQPSCFDLETAPVARKKTTLGKIPRASLKGAQATN